MTTNEVPLPMSSEGHPTLKQVAARAPNTSNSYSRPRDCDITEEELAGLTLADEKQLGPIYRSERLTHEEGDCNHLSLCVRCASLKKTLKLMRKVPTQTENIVEQYYIALGKMPTHLFCVRVSQDTLTFGKQTVFMKAQIARGLKKYSHHIATKYRTGMLRAFMCENHNTKDTDQERTEARDEKYESMFLAQGLGPIEHQRGNCEEHWSMCEDCINIHRCYVIHKNYPERSRAAYALFWRLFNDSPQHRARAFVSDTRAFMKHTTIVGVNLFLNSYYANNPELGPNYAERAELYGMAQLRKHHLEEKFNPTPDVVRTNPYLRETPFESQAFASIDFNIPSIDRITDMLSKLITDNNIGARASEWIRRMTSFFLMLVQLCAHSSLVVKIAAVAQFLTHFDLPGIAVFQGYAQQLAQVFQAAIERIRRHRYDLHEHLTDNDDDEDEHIYDADAEGPFVAQGDEEKRPDGLLVGTAKLLCAMAGVTDYDIKANGARIARIDQLSRTIVSTERLAQFVGRLFKYAYEMAMVHVFKIHPDMHELALVSEAIPKWMEDVTNYYNAEGMMRVTKNADEARQVLKWHKQGDEYNSLLWKFKVVPKAYAIFKNVYNMCDKMYQAGAPYLAESAMRVSPFTILITGGPGLGKSVMQYSLITDLMRRSFARRGLVFRPGEQVHVHNAGGKHWDGYKEQAVVCVDDIFQSMDPAETIEQCMDLCRMKNMVSWPVAKADLASKGSVFMVSELLVMTGNVGVPHDITKHIRSFDAIRRRIDMLVEHTVVPEYCDASGRLDKVKVAAAFPITYVDGLPVSGDITPIFRFNVINNQGQKIMKNGTYPDLIELANGMKEWEKEHEEAVIRLNYLRAGLDVRGQPTETYFEAQGFPFGAKEKEPEDNYAGDLLFESDVMYVQRLMDDAEKIVRRQCPHQRIDTLSPLDDPNFVECQPSTSRPFPREGFLTEEERLEIFATIAQQQTADPSWSDKMRAVYNRCRKTATTVGMRFCSSIASWVDTFRASITDSMLFKIGAMVTVTVSIISIGFLSYRLFARDKPVDIEVNEKEAQDLFAETSGDEKTRQTRTVFAETSGDEKTRQTRTTFEHTAQNETESVRIIGGRKCVAVAKTSRKTIWVPESKIGNRKPLAIKDVLWTDDGEELPHDVISKKDDEYVAQACPDRNAYNIGVNRVTNNAVVVQHHTPDGNLVARLRGLFVYGRVLMIPNHFFHAIDDDADIEVLNSHGLSQKFNLRECDRKTPNEEMDITFLRLPKRFQCYADIRSHFHSMEGLNKFSLSDAMLWVIDGENNGKMIALCNNIAKDTVLDYRVVSAKKDLNDKNVHLVKSYVYHGVTLGGYCGAPLIWLNPSVQGGHILGIHVAGTNLRGVTTPVTKEFLYSFLSKWDDISIRVPDLSPLEGEMLAQSKKAVNKKLGLAHYGKVSRANQVRLPTDTTIIPSPLFGVFEPVTGPAVLRATKELNPLRSGILKQKVPLVVFPQHVVDEAVRHLRNTILSCDSPYRRKPIVLTAEEALNGFPGDRWTPPMNLHTSPGYPYINSNTSRNGKFDFVHGEVGERQLHEIVRERLDERIRDGENRVVKMTLFMDILKDERVKLEKIKLGKTRIFNVAPFDLNVAVRMYFQSFASHIMHNHVYGECAVGLNPHSDEWGMVYQHLHNLSDNWIGGDYSNYDKQLSYQLLKAVLTIIDEFYSDGNENVRECLFETMFSAFHIAEQDVYRVPQGNPSGIVMTSIINSLVNSLMMRIMYVELGGSLTTFDDNVRIITYGDDNLGTVSDQVPWFNMNSISQKFAEYGIVYNKPNKEAMNEEDVYMRRDEITFLKREFVVRNSRVFAPLAIDSIHEMVNWIRKSNDDIEATRANFLAACREMYHHGREAFETFTSHVYAFAQKRALKLPHTDYLTSGEYWGAESAGRVNLPSIQTTQDDVYCCDLENEETVFTAQSERAPRKTKAVWPSLRELLIIAMIIYSTSKTQTPSENTSASATNDDNITTRTEITTFSDSSVVTMTSPQNTAPVPPTPVDPYMKQTLTDYLSRVYYYSGEWSAAAAPGSLIAQITFPNFLFSVPQIWDKLKNFTYFRAGVKIGLRINGSKFHFGQMLVSYSPNYNNTCDLQNATNNIYSASGCPSFTISPSENEVHEFTLPFSLPYQYIPMYYTTSVVGGDPAFQFGVMNMYVLNPLSNSNGTPTPVSYTIFANFVDVDVAGYNPISYTIPVRQFRTQADLPATLVNVPPRPSTVVQLDPLPPFVALAEDPFLAQGASREQQSKSEKGIVGGVLESVSTISGALSFIPEIGAVAAGVSAVAGVGAKVANYFGWTNPVSLRAMQPVIKQWTNMVNTHGLVDSQNLALSADSIISQQAELLGGTPEEMNMLYIAQTPMLLAAGITWSATDITNTGLWETPVTPLAEFYDVAKVRVFPTFLSWVSRACMEWRGSIKYHFQITCSQMHVGRLRISFIPLNSLSQLDDNEFASGATFILDIQQQTDVSFTIPYLSFQPWQVTRYVQGDGVVITPNIGLIRLSVLNELNHPTTPVPSVYINVWTSAGPDFQLARPTGAWLRGNWTTTTNDPEPPEEEFVAQGLTRESIRMMPAPPLIPANGSRESFICNADEFHHIKDLIMRPSWIGTTIAIGPSDVAGLATIDPFVPVARYTVATPNQMDYLSYFRLIFRYCRGSHRVVATPNNNTLNNALCTNVISNSITYRSGGPTLGSFPRYVNTTSAANDVIMQSGTKDGMIFTQSDQSNTAVIPYYSTTYALPIGAWAGAPTVQRFSVYGQAPAINVYYQGKPQISLAAGDDYELIFLVGPPALTSNNS